MPDAPEQPTAGLWQRYGRRAIALLVAGVSLYFVLPSLVAVFSSFRSLSGVRWEWVAPMLACEGLSYFAIWELDRIALHVRSWCVVASAQLSGNTVGRVLPGGGATSTAFAVGMLHTAGVDTGEATAALSASSLLQLATTFALPVLALPAILGGAPVAHSLAMAAYLGIAVALALLAFGAIAFRTDRPLEDAGRAAQWLVNHTVRRRRPVSGLPQKLLADRDFIRTTLGDDWKGAAASAAASAGFDYLALLCALLAVGANPRPSLVLLAYTTAEVLALIPLTPGGLGFVEAGLVGTLTLAGVSGRDALAATLLYRLAAYWIPLLAGPVAYVAFRRRYGLRSSRTRSAASPIPCDPAPGESRAVNRPAGR
jgi:uncharacterized protein (TIRG00374 family)